MLKQTDPIDLDAMREEDGETEKVLNELSIELEDTVIAQGQSEKQADHQSPINMQDFNVDNQI